MVEKTVRRSIAITPVMREQLALLASNNRATSPKLTSSVRRFGVIWMSKPTFWRGCGSSRLILS